MQSGQRWPLKNDVDFVASETDYYDEILTIFVPLSALRPGAETFSDWPKGSTVNNMQPNRGSAWFMFTLVYLKMVEIVLHRGMGKSSYLWEAVVDNNGDVLGYSFWLLYSYPKSHEGETGDEFTWKQTVDELVYSKVIRYYRTLIRMIARGGNDDDIRAAKSAKKRIDRGGLTTVESWKYIRSDRQWSAMVGLCTGVRNSTDHEMASSVSKGAFKPETAIGMRPINTCQKQSMIAWDGIPGSLPGYHVVVPGYGRKIQWPDTSLVYNVHPDMCYVIDLFKCMLPHRQIEHMRTENILHIFLPEISQDHHDDASSIQRTVAMMHGMLPADDSYTAGGDIRSCANLLEVRGVTGTLADVARAKASATPYHDIAAATDRVLHMIPKLVANDAPDVAAIKSRKIELLVRNAAMASYGSSCRWSSKMSPSMALLLDQIDSHGLFNLKTTRKWYKRPPKESSQTRVSFYGSYTRKCYTTLEHVFHINYLHKYCVIAEICSLDAYRHVLGLHLNLCALSENGGVGKSNIWTILTLLRADGTVMLLMYTTPAAATGGEGDNINMSDRITIYDEMPPSMFNGEATLSDAQARFKMILSEGFAHMESIVVDEDGKRQKMQCYVQHVGTVFMSSNLMDASLSMSRRFLMASISENPSVQRSLIDTMNQEALDCSRMGDLKMAFRVVHWQKQALYATVEKLIHCGALPAVSCHISGVLNLAFMQQLRKLSTSMPEPNASVFTRINLLARNLCIGRVLIDSLLSPDEGTEGKRSKPRPDSIEPADLSCIEKRLFVTAEDYVGAVGMMVDQLVNPLDHAVSLALRFLYDEKKDAAETAEDYADAFHGEVHPTTGADGNMKLDHSIDWNYLKWPAKTLVTRIAVLVPSLMNGIESNRGAIEKCLRSFCKRSIKSKGYIAPTNSMPPFAANLDDASKEKLWPVAMMPNKRPGDSTSSGDILVHIAFLPDSSTAASFLGNSWDGASAEAKMVGTALKNVLSAKTMLKRTMVFTTRCDVPSKLVYLTTGENADSKDFTRIKLVTVASAEDFEISPELKDMATEGEYFDVHEDLDTYAMRKHFEAIHVSRDPISPSFMDTVLPPHHSAEEPPGSAASSHGMGNDLMMCMASTIEGDDVPMRTADETRSGRCFAGVPVEELSPDSYSKWLRGRRDVTAAALAQQGDYDDDVDFDFAEFTAVAHNGTLRPHWLEIHERFDPRFFGFKEWASTDCERVQQYKMICYHPAMVSDFDENLLGI